MKRILYFCILALPFVAHAQYGGVFAAGSSSSPTIANVTVSGTPGNTVPSSYLGMSEPSGDFTWWPRGTNCGGANQPKCASNTIMTQLISNWTSLYSHPLFFRIEMDPTNPYDFQCYISPIGAAITGASGTPYTWTSDGAGNATLYLPSSAVFTSTGGGPAPYNGTITTSSWGSGVTSFTVGSTTGLVSGQTVYGVGIPAGTTMTLSGSTVNLTNTTTASGTNAVFGSAPQTSGSYASVYIHGFASSAATAAGLNNPSTPANITTAYTITGSTSTTITITGLPVTGTSQHGTETGYITPAPQWYPNIPACGTGTLFPPTSAVVDSVVGILAGNSNVDVTVAADLASSQYCNGHRFGPVVGNGTYLGGIPPAIGCYATKTVPQWNMALASYSSQWAGIELGNEPDDYSSQVLTNFWGYRFPSYGAVATGLTNVDIPFLSQGSSQLISGSPNGTTTITDINGSGAKVNLTLTGGVCTAVTINTAGTVTFGGTLPSFPVSLGGTPCVIEAQVEGWFQDFVDVQNDLNTNSANPTTGIKWLDPSTAGNGMHATIIGGPGTVTCDPTSSSTAGCGGGVPITPNGLNLISPGAGLTGIGNFSQHNYPYGKSTFCPTYPIASISRSGSTFPATSTTTVTTSQPTNFQTSIALGAETYASGTGLITASLADLDTISQYSCSNTLVGNSAQCTITTSTTPNVTVGQVVQLNGSGVDSTTAGQPLKVISVGSNSYVATWPLLADSGSGNTSACSSACYDQLFIYSGATAGTSGITGGSGSWNYGGFTIASSTPKTRSTVNGVPGATITFTTVGQTISGTTATGGTLTMTGMPAVNITNTPLGINGTSLDLVPVIGCPNNAGNAYAYPACGFYNYTGCSITNNVYPYCGTHALAYKSASFNLLGTPTALACSSPTSCTVPQQGLADSATSGVLTLVTGTATNSLINVPANANCIPQDVQTYPAAGQKSTTLEADTTIETKGLSIGTYSGGGGLSTPISYRLGETNFMSPAQHGISDTIQQALMADVDFLNLATFNGTSGLLNSTGLASPANTFALSGMDGFNFFTGESNAYALWNWQFSPTCGATCTNFLQDTTTNDSPAVQGGYYGMWTLFDFFGSATGTNWLPCTGTTITPNLNCYAVKNGSDSHTHIMLVNQSETITGNVVITATGMNSGTQTVLSVPDVSTPAGQSIAAEQIQATVTGVSGQTVTFSVPCVAQPSTSFSGINLMYNMPLYLNITGLSGISSQWVYVSTTGHTKPAANCSPSTASFQATVVGTASSLSGQTVTAYEGCPVVESTPWFCTWGITLGGSSTVSWDGSYTGSPLGTLTPYNINGSSHVFNVTIGPLSTVLLDLHP